MAKETENNRLLILGFDGASPDLLERWVDDGHLPNFKRVMTEGVYGPLQSVPNMSSPPAWTSFATGKNPGKHGIFCFTERNFDSYRYTYVNGGFRRAETFWQMLCGERTGCIINVPMTYPTHEINGCMIAGLDAPGLESEAVCWPRGLVDEMVKKNGEYKVTPDFANLLRKGENWGAAADRLLDNMETRYRHTIYLMDEYDWDLFTVVFGETDLAHHFFWKFLDPSHPDCSEEEHKEHSDTILRIYKKMDDILGRMLEKYPEVTIMIMSDHGGGLNPRGNQLVSDWLESVGLLKKEEIFRSPLKRGWSSLAGWAFRFANRHLSKNTKIRLARIFPSLRGSAEAASRLGGIDWTKTKAFCDGAQDDIWINLKGRDPSGVVSEAEYDEICDFICSELRDAVDVVTGEPLVDEIYRRHEKFHGNYVDRAADISLRWRGDAVMSGIRTKSSPEKLEPMDWDWPPDLPTGGHSLNGIILARGEKIASGKRVSGAGITDIAPTVLYHFGEPIPEDFDGRIIESIFTQEHVENNPPRYGARVEAEVDEEKDVYSNEDSEVIEQRLRDLGYI